MQEDLLGLTREVERVITTPYTPSLHGLERIVDNISYGCLRQWADCKPCRVPLLAAVVLEQLPYTVNLLARFGYIQELRDALLDREPSLLDQLLQSAIENGNDENLNVCVSMLACPVPRHVAVPARVPIFLTKLLHNVVENPCPASIKPLYEVMQGLLSNSELIKLLPNDLMETFQREGTKILRNLNDPLATLLSLATFARIRRLWQPATSRDNYRPQWLANICQIFGPKSASKTLDLVVISAVMACSASSDQHSLEDRILLVRLAIEICHDIDEELKKVWLGANSAKLGKLCDKLRRPDINAELQVMGLTLIINFSNRLSLSREIYQMMRDRLFKETMWNAINGVSEIERETLLERLVNHCGDNGNLDLFNYAISALQSNKDMDGSSLSKIKLSLLSLSMLKRLHNLVERQSYFQHLPVEDARNLRAYAQAFSSRDKSSRCEESLVCYGTIHTWKDRLFLELLSLFYLESSTNGGAQGSSHPQELIESFIDSLKEKATKRSSCLLSQLKEPERISGLVREKSKPAAILNTDGSSREWRSKVTGLLLDHAQTSHETVIQQMEAICQDFETRCMNVEQPLAMAAQERDQLRQELEDSKRRNLELEDQARQSMELVNTLKEQMEASAKQVNDYSFQVEHLTDQMDALQTELDDTRKESQESIEVVRSKARDRELDLMATVSERDDLLEEQQEEINAMSKERAQFKQAMDTASEQHQAMSRESEELRQEITRLQKEAVQERDALQHEVTKLQQVMEIRESTNVEKDNRIMALSSTTQDLHNENQVLKDKLEQEKSNGETLMSGLEEARQNYQNSIADMEARFEEQISQAHKQAQKMTDRHSLEVAALKKDAANTAARSEKDLRAKDKKIQYLEKKVDSLRNERAAKAREFSEAQEYITRLMSVMGVSKAPKDDNSKRRADATSKSIQDVRRSNRLSELHTQSCPPSQADITTLSTAMETQFSIAPAPLPATDTFRFDTTNTAARRRSHRLSGVTSFANDSTYSFLPDQKELGRLGADETQRQPLGNVDKNTPPKSSPPNHTKGSDKGPPARVAESQANANITELGDIDLDFDDDELLTSTVAR